MRKLSFIALLFFNFAFSQNYDLGKVTVAELQEKAHPTDTSAVAAVLFKKGKTIFKYFDGKDFISYTEFSTKIKIYKKEGLDWANFEIPYYVGYEKLADEFVEITKAFTYNLENGKVEKTKVTGEGKFIKQKNEYWKTKSVTFPNVKVGSIIELKYVLKSENLSVLPDFQYQYKIPVNYMEYVTEIPEYYIYKAMKTGFVDIQIKDKIESVSQTFEEKVDKASQSSRVTYNQIKTTYTARDIPALVEEKYVNNMYNYLGRIEQELQVFRNYNEKPKQMATTWEDVAKSIYERKDFGVELDKSSYFLNDIKILATSDAPDRERMTKLFEFVRNRMNWNGTYGYSTDKGVEVAYREKTGNIADINLMLTAVLKISGFDAKPVLISTRNNGVAMFPNRFKFNAVITAVTMDNEIILLDATSKNALPNILPTRDLNWYGRMISMGGSSSEIDLMPNAISKEVVNLMATIKNDGTVEGKGKVQYLDYSAYDFREKYGILANEAQVELLENFSKGIEVQDYTVANVAELDKPVIQSYSYQHNSIVDIIGDKMYFSPLLFFALNDNPFKQENREYPVDFSYPKQVKYLINITIPDNYVVEKLPENLSVPMSEGKGSMKYLVSHKDKQIQLSVTLDINSAIIAPESYNELKSFYAEVVKKQTEKIVLKKV